MHAIPWYIAVLISFPQTILIIEFGFRLFNLRPKTKQIIILSAIIALMCFFMRRLSISYAANTLILIAVLSLCTWILCRIDIRYCLISVILGALIYVSLETMLLPVIMRILELSFDALIISPWFNLVAFLPVLMIALLLLGFVIKKRIVLYDFGAEEDAHENWFVALVILLQTLLMVLINISIISSNDLTDLKMGIPYINLGILLMGVSSLFSIKKIEKNAKYHTSNLLLKNHLTQMESILTSSQAQRHEYSKHMQNLQALIELNKIEEAKAYVNGLTENYWSKPMTVSPFNHPAVEGLINSKNSVAQVQNIDFAVAVKCDMSKIRIPDWDLCSILGNLLDNAFEAAAADEEPRVGIEFKHEDNRFAIYINNNGFRISEPKKVLAAGYTTKASEGRGYGLYIVNKLTQKYQGTIEIVTRPKTTVILRFPGGNDNYD